MLHRARWRRVRASRLYRARRRGTDGMYTSSVVRTAMRGGDHFVTCTEVPMTLIEEATKGGHVTHFSCVDMALNMTPEQLPTAARVQDDGSTANRTGVRVLHWSRGGVWLYRRNCVAGSVVRRGKGLLQALVALHLRKGNGAVRRWR